MTSGARPGEGVTSADRVLQLLHALMAREQLRVAEAAELLGVSRPTAHRLLVTLARNRIASQEYQNGPYTLALGFASRAAQSPRAAKLEIAHQLATTLRDDTGETVHFAVLQGNSCRFIASALGTYARSTPSRVDMVLPAHATAPGKAMLAVLPPERLRDLYPRGVQTITDATLGSTEEIDRHLHDVARRGYATNVAESDAALAAVAVVVRDGSGAMIGSLAISGPLDRMTPDRMPRLAVRMQRVALEFQSQHAAEATI